MEKNNEEKNVEKKANGNSQQQIAGAIIIAGLIIAGAVLLKGNRLITTENNTTTDNPVSGITLAPVGAEDRTLGNPQAKITFVLYEDFQCPFCGQFDREVEQNIRNSYVKDGTVQLVYRDFSFLGEFVKPYVAAKDESLNSAEAARCAGDQGKFWEYHDYLFAHQNGENQENFSVAHLESFAKELNLDTGSFNQCLTSAKYAKAVSDSKVEASNAGVSGTPKGFFITEKDISSKAKDTINQVIKALNLPPNSPPMVSFYTTKNIMSINGALSWDATKTIIDTLLK